jgi:methionyl aminopeptidase
MLQTHTKLYLKENERKLMRRAGQFNAQLMDHLRQYVKPGITTGEIDEIVYQYTISHKCRPATLGYQGYPKSCCTSINEVICHGIPDHTVLREGDIVNIDVTSVVDGWYGDQSETFLVGQCSADAIQVTQCAFDALYAAIDNLTPGCTVSCIGDAVVKTATSRGLSVVREYVGHGLGKKFHQFPNVPHYPDRKSRQDKIMPGLCFTVEPMINQGSRFGKVDTKDNWTVRTRDGKLSAQFEHTVMMTEKGPEILTLTQTGPQRGHRFA